MLLPLVLICGAVLSAAVVAYGTDPNLAQLAHGIHLIMLGRRLEWPMVVLSLLLCAVLFAVTISGRRRVWWLIGLAPVLALFVRGFASVYRPTIHLLESPVFVQSEQAGSAMTSDEYVVGILFEGKAFALPYRALNQTPLVLLTQYDKRVLVIWSMTANHATVVPLDRDTQPRELEVVSQPADSLLLFDGRLGQFIVGVTGRTVADAKPIGFGTPLPTVKEPFANWLAAHPDTLVLDEAATDASEPSTPVMPALHFIVDQKGAGGRTSMAMIATTQPAAISADAIITQPINLTAGETRVLLVREPKTGKLHAYDRRLNEDLFLTLTPLKKPIRKHPEIVLVDAESQSSWTLDARAMDGSLKGQHLREIPVEEGLYWGVMKFWMPDLQWIDVK